MSTVLIVEDSSSVAELLKLELSKRGFDCVVEIDGLAGLKRAKKIDPDIIILDVMLPSMNGFKICRLLKFDKKYKHIPVIMLTTRSDEDDRKLGSSTGADSYMTKPFEIDEIHKEIERLLNIKEVTEDTASVK